MMRQALVLIPGMLNNAMLWDTVASKLADVADVTIPVFEHENSLAAMADSVLARAPAGPLAVAGFSMGGWVAQEIVRRAKDRVTRLAFISSGSGPADERERNAFARTSKSEGFDFQAMLEKMFPVAVHASRLNDAALRAAAINMWRKVGDATYQRQRRAVVDRPDLRSHLRNLDVPVLIACGRDDQVLPPALSHELALLVPHARLVFIEQCGHMTPLEHPDEVTRLLRQWLDVPKELPHA
jgi:pimeloyl-ACP methyl ester carboxylesterase